MYHTPKACDCVREDPGHGSTWMTAALDCKRCCPDTISPCDCPLPDQWYLCAFTPLPVSTDEVAAHKEAAAAADAHTATLRSQLAQAQAAAEAAQAAAAGWQQERLLLEKEVQEAQAKSAQLQKQLQGALSEGAEAADRADLLQLQLTAAQEAAAAAVAVAAEAEGGGEAADALRASLARDWKVEELEKLQAEKRDLQDQVGGWVGG